MLSVAVAPTTRLLSEIERRLRLREDLGLKYDNQKKVVSNKALPSIKYPVMAFGEDEKGEVYFLIASAKGQSVFKFTK